MYILVEEISEHEAKERNAMINHLNASKSM